MKIKATIFLLFIAIVRLSANTVSIDFYNDWITLEYNATLFANYGGDISNEEEMIRFFKELEKREHQTFVASLKRNVKEYRLNDWLTYRLVEKTLDELCRSRSDRYQGVFSWFIMSELGYDARATFTKRDFYVNVATKEQVFESPMFEVKGESFANLSVILRKGKTVRMVYGVEYAPTPNGKDFSFALNELPLLQAKKKNYNYRFEHKGKKYNIAAQVDRTLVDIMQEYPKFDEMYFVQTPLSESTKKTLLPALKREMIGMSNSEKMEFLVAFTRRGLKYGSDRRSFGDSNKPLIAEETLFYPSVDCEDKVAVMYNLVKELTNLDAIVLAMPEHLSFAVKLSTPIGKIYRHKGRKYTICDPTGPENTSEIGVFPFDAELRKGEVLGEL